mmetsp:Transcript_13025/g.36664  ORF Transcript_13025/g.36664 Transcript_13025/m.36664 type:complete len:279 (+) Transcript_13025:13-849(+)
MYSPTKTKYFVFTTSSFFILTNARQNYRVSFMLLSICLPTSIIALKIKITSVVGSFLFVSVRLEGYCYHSRTNQRFSHDKSLLKFFADNSFLVFGTGHLHHRLVQLVIEFCSDRFDFGHPHLFELVQNVLVGLLVGGFDDLFRFGLGNNNSRGSIEVVQEIQNSLHNSYLCVRVTLLVLFGHSLLNIRVLSLKGFELGSPFLLCDFFSFRGSDQFFFRVGNVALENFQLAFQKGGRTENIVHVGSGGRGGIIAVGGVGGLRGFLFGGHAQTRWHVNSG